MKHVSKSGIVAYYIYKKNNVPSKYISDKPTFDKIMKNLYQDTESESSKNNKNDSNDTVSLYRILIYIFILSFSQRKTMKHI